MAKQNLVIIAGSMAVLGVAFLFNVDKRFEEGKTYEVSTYRRGSGEFVSSRIVDGSETVRLFTLIGTGLLLGAGLVVFFGFKKKG